MADSSRIAARISALTGTTSIHLIDISILFQGAGRVVLETVLEENKEQVSSLRRAHFQSPDREADLRKQGVDRVEVVATDVDADGSIIVFARPR